MCNLMIEKKKQVKEASFSFTQPENVKRQNGGMGGYVEAEAAIGGGGWSVSVFQTVVKPEGFLSMVPDTIIQTHTNQLLQN